MDDQVEPTSFVVREGERGDVDWGIRTRRMAREESFETLEDDQLGRNGVLG